MTDIQPAGQQPMSDDQELAKVLAGITGETETDDAVPEPAQTTPSVPPTGVLSAPDEQKSEEVPTPTVPSFGTPDPTVDAPTLPSPSLSPSNDLDDIKKDALVELRPLVDKLSLEPEEKFDTYLLLLRSTDDKDLIAPAHEAAKSIADETRRAQALLDIIKEIDYLSGQKAT